MKILIFIEHDIIIRHFIHSRIFDELAKRHDIKFVFPEPGYKRVNSDVSKLELSVPYKHLTVHQDRLVLWNRLFTADSLRWRRGAQFAALRRFRRYAIGPKALLLYSLLSLPGVFTVLKRWTFSKIKAQPNEQLDDLLDAEKPDIIIHPSILEGVYINDLVEVTQARNIPFVVIMNSWDNPSTKKAVIGYPDWLLVWGEQTKRHAMDYMDMPADRIVTFGAAQFDIYRDSPRQSREDFCRNHEIDPSATILLYAGSSKDSDEFQHLVAIDDAISAGKLGNVVTVYRPHPWGRGGRNGARLLDHPWKNVRIENSMRDYLERVRAGDLGMNLADYHHTHDVLSSIDALVSPLSTIIIEGALHGKPVLCFLPMEEKGARHFQMTAPLTHFEDMYTMPEFLVATGGSQLLPKLSELLKLAHKKDVADGLRRACELFVEPFDKSYSDRLVDFVGSLAIEHDAAQKPQMSASVAP